MNFFHFLYVGKTFFRTFREIKWILFDTYPKNKKRNTQCVSLITLRGFNIYDFFCKFKVERLKKYFRRLAMWIWFIIILICCFWLLSKFRSADKISCSANENGIIIHFWVTHLDLISIKIFFVHLRESLCCCQ